MPGLRDYATKACRHIGVDESAFYRWAFGDVDPRLPDSYTLANWNRLHGHLLALDGRDGLDETVPDMVSLFKAEGRK